MLAAGTVFASPALAQDLTDAEMKEINCVYTGVAALETDDFYAVVDATVAQSTEGALYERAEGLLLDIVSDCVEIYDWDDTEVEFGLMIGAYGAVSDAVTANLEEDGVLDQAMAAVDKTVDALSNDDLVLIYNGELLTNSGVRGRATALMKQHGMPEVEPVTLEDALLYLTAMVIGSVYIEDWVDLRGF